MGTKLYSIDQLPDEPVVYGRFYIQLSTLLGIITMGLFTTGKKWFREKYGGIRRNPPHYPGREFTSDQPFTFKIGNYRHGAFH